MHQGFMDKLKESLGMRHKGKKKQSLKARADESEGMEKKMGKKLTLAYRRWIRALKNFLE